MSIPTSINSKHWQEWQASSVSDEIIALNAWTLEDSREVDQLLNRNTERRWKHSAELAPGWAVAGCDPLTGERSLVGCQFKPNTPPTSSSSGKPLKYFTASDTPASPLFLNMPNAAYWASVYEDVSVPIVLTEGAKKAGAVLTRGVAGVSIPGVSTGGKLGRLKPQLKKLCTYGRKIYLAFDRDVVYKRQVQQALHNLARMITERGAMVYIVEWHDDYKGIDDYFAGRPDGMPLDVMMQRAATLEEWRADQKERETELIDEPCKLSARFQRVSSKLKSRLRWNSLLQRMELDNERISAEDLRMTLALRHNLDVPQGDCTPICVYLSKQASYNPVTEYLDACADTYAPDSDYLDKVAETFLGASSELHRTMLRKTLIGAVARAYDNGCKLDNVCILAGGQGVGKSSFWRILAGEWFDDSYGSGTEKDELMKLHRCWIVEWAEVDVLFKRKDISTMKKFISCQRDAFRPPYGTITEDFERPSIFVGSTNENAFLGDATGNRRYWVIPVGSFRVPQPQLLEERDRIWAAAVQAYRAGEHWDLPPQMWEEAAAATADYQSSDLWEDLVATYIEGKDKVTVAEVLEHGCHVELAQAGKAQEMRVTDLLKRLGLSSRRLVDGGRKKTFWIREVLPQNDLEVCPLNKQDLQKVEDIRDRGMDTPPDTPLDTPPPEDTPKVCPLEKNGQKGEPTLSAQRHRTYLTDLTDLSGKPLKNQKKPRKIGGPKIEGANCHMLLDGEMAWHGRVIKAADRLQPCHKCEGDAMVHYLVESERLRGGIREGWYCACQLDRYKIEFYTPSKEKKSNA